jgi:NADPH:quinone reductase-like Zn-dependent oxidoreductase
MRVIEVPQYGGPEVLRLVERPDPQPRPGKVRVRMHATGVNPADLATRQGVFALRTPNLPFPFVLGWEIAGTVIDDSAGFTAGQRVIGQLPWLALGNGEGTNAEIVVADPAWLAPLPDKVDWAHAATLGLNSLTARQGLDQTGAKPGDTVLITGASGAVGGFAVQLGAHDGLNVIGLASAGDEDYVTGLGAKQVVTRGGPLPANVDAMFDAALISDLTPVRDGGTYVGATDPALPEPQRGISVTAVHTTPNGEQLKELVRLHSRVADVLPVEQAADAHRRVRAGGFRGKIVLSF